MLMERDQITSLINAMVVEQAEVIVVAVDAQGGILFLNPGAAEMFEITEGANIGQPFSNLLGEAVPEELVSEKPVRYRFAGSDGEERWMRGFWSRLDGADSVRVYVAKDFTRDYFLQRDLVLMFYKNQYQILSYEFRRQWEYLDSILVVPHYQLVSCYVS